MNTFEKSILTAVIVLAIMSGIAFMMGRFGGGITGAAVSDTCGEDCLSNNHCEDGNACTVDSCLTDGECALTCSNVQITECVAGDGCCPVGCTGTDSDC